MLNENTFPPALQGCWTLDDPDKEADVGEVIEIAHNRLSVVASWMAKKPVLVEPELIEGITATTVRGRFTWQEDDHRATYATEIGIGIRGAPANRLVVAEGDAGSRWFSRCKKESAK